MDEDQAKELGRYLRRHREAAGLSFRQLAAAVDIDPAQLVRLERGGVAFPRADLLGRIASELRLPVADVLTLAGYPTSRQLPNLRPYMRAKYRNLPPEAVDEVEAFIEDLAKRHGGNGPASGEDER